MVHSALNYCACRSTPDVWGYFSVSSQGGVHEFSDSQFGHLFAQGETREIARRSMVVALKELSIRGDIRTTVEYLRSDLFVHLVPTSPPQLDLVGNSWRVRNTNATKLTPCGLSEFYVTAQWSARSQKLTWQSFLVSPILCAAIAQADLL